MALAIAVPTALASAPFLVVRTEAGEPGLVRALCAGLDGPTAVVVTGVRGRLELPAVVRGECGLPTGVVVENELAARLPSVRAHVSAAGRQLVVLSEDPAPLRAAGLHPAQLARLRTREDARKLATRPKSTSSLSFQFWVARM